MNVQHKAVILIGCALCWTFIGSAVFYVMHMQIIGTFHFTHMRAFIYSIRHIYYRWMRAYAWNGTYLMSFCVR